MNSSAIVSDKQLGDVTLLEPASRWLAALTGRPCAMHVKPAFKSLISLMPHAVFGEEGTKEMYDQIWTTSWSSRAALQALRLKGRQKIILANKPRHLRWWYRLIFHKRIISPANAEYWGRYFWTQVGGQPLEQFQSAQLNPPPPSWAHAELPPQPFLLINPTAAWETKFWSVTQWRELICSLRNDRDQPIVMTGGRTPMEMTHGSEIAEGLDVINLVGRTSLEQYLHALSRASTVLCVDGAASHLAHALGVPTLTLFGPTSDEKWHWSGEKRIALAARQFTGLGYGPVTGIPVHSAYEAALRLLQQPAADRRPS